MPKYDYYNNDTEWKEMHKERMKEKGECPECGCTVNKYAMVRHRRSNKHKMKVMMMTMSKDNLSKKDINKIKALLG